MPGWNQSTKEIASFDKLPEEAMRYIERICELVNTPLSILSLGPEREKTVFIQDLLKK